jgi:chromosome segregation ATPase
METHTQPSIYPAVVPAQNAIDTLQSKQESSDDRQREFAEKLQQHQTQVAAAQQTFEAVQARCAEAQAAQEAIMAQKQSKEEEVRATQSRCV